MKVEWNEYQEWPDGSGSSYVEGHIYIGENEYEILIEDHTLENSKANDKANKRSVSHAYNVDGLPFLVKPEIILKYGFEPAAGSVSSVGIDRNPGYSNWKSRHEYVGTPEHTIKDVERLVEKCFIEKFKFDYDKELKKLMKNLNKRKTLMEEVEEYESSNHSNQLT